jgi:hypothetical protein
LISVTICSALISGNSKLNFYDPNMMNITIRQNIMSVSESDPRIQTEKEKLSTSVSAVSDPFSSLVAAVVVVDINICCGG